MNRPGQGCALAAVTMLVAFGAACADDSSSGELKEREATPSTTTATPVPTLDVFATGRVTVSQSFVGCCEPEEGSLSYVFLRDPAGDVVSTLTTETSYEGGPQRLLEIGLLAGPYELESFQRACAGSCEGLDPPSNRCTRDVQVLPNETVDIVIEFGDGRCRDNVGP